MNNLKNKISQAITDTMPRANNGEILDKCLHSDLIVSINEVLDAHSYETIKDKKTNNAPITICEHKRIRENITGGRFDECLDCGKTWG